MSQLLHLQNRKRNLSWKITNNRTTIRNLDNRLTRLKNAKRQISSALTTLRSSRNKVNRLSVSALAWRGNRKNNFNEKYDRYKSSVKTYVTKVEDSLESISEEISNIEAKKSTYLANITAMQNTIEILNTQIDVIERTMKNG
ncbi:YwqH-like family protein [Amphibacillus cookii]|uniref:YwqH-like family protein n=1 Tax=Amphibacillus cookii TaxID=767787 RepID=UPI001959C967|nr:DUF5082 family protein [Amphibacillus cookii]MBM7541132.1 uncharacterized protein YukE [Amphibacillus cookii]